MKAVLWILAIALALFFWWVLSGCSPVEVEDGYYAGSWFGSTETEVLQLNIQHEVSGVHGVEITGNGTLLWMGNLYVLSMTDVTVDGDMSGTLIIKNAGRSDGQVFDVPGWIVTGKPHAECSTVRPQSR